MRFRSPVVEASVRRPDPSADVGVRRASRVSLFVVASIAGLGMVATPWLVGALGLAAFGEVLAAPPDRVPTSRGQLYLVLAGIVCGVSAWFPDRFDVSLRIALALLVAPFVYVPALVADAALSFREACARSLDLTLRSGLRSVAATFGFLSFFVAGPMCAGLLRHPRGWPPLELLGFGVLVACSAVACALVACLVLRWLARAAFDRARHEARVTPVGLAFVATTVVLAASVAASPFAALAGSDARISLPTAIAVSPEGALDISMIGTDGLTWDLVVSRSRIEVRTGWMWHAPRNLGGVPIHAAFVAVLVTLALAAAIVLARRSRRFGTSMLRARVVRARILPTDLVELGGALHLPVASEIRLVDEGVTTSSEHRIEVRGVSESERESTEPLSCSLVVPGSWRAGAAYRSASSHLPKGVRIVTGDLETAVFAARIADIERALRITLGLFATPMLLLVGAVVVAVVRGPYR